MLSLRAKLAVFPNNTSQLPVFTNVLKHCRQIPIGDSSENFLLPASTGRGLAKG